MIGAGWSYSTCWLDSYNALVPRINTDMGNIGGRPGWACGNRGHQGKFGVGAIQAPQHAQHATFVDKRGSEHPIASFKSPYRDAHVRSIDRATRATGIDGSLHNACNNVCSLGSSHFAVLSFDLLILGRFWHVWMEHHHRRHRRL